MISIKNRKMLIPNEERYIGTTFDDNSEVRTFKISRYTQTDIDLSAFTAKADIFHCDTETTDRADLEMEVQAKYILLHLYITAGMVATPGTRLIDLKLFNDDGEVKWSSYKGAFYVEDPFTTPQATLENLTELEQLEARINRAIATAYEKAAEVVSAWLEENISEIEGYVIDKSLTVENAAADAKTVGDKLGNSGFYDGLAITTGTYTNDSGRDTAYYLVTVPKTDPDGDTIPIEAAYDPDTTPLTHAQKDLTTLTTNSSLDFPTGKPAVIHDGQIVRESTFDSLVSTYPYAVYVGFDANRVPHEYPITTAASAMITDGILEASVAYYRLVTDGVARDVSNIGLSAAQLAANPRTAIFTTSGGAICFLACDGRENIDEGLKPEELAALMISLGAVQGWNLDGGGSSSLVSKGSKLNRNIDGSGTRDRSVVVTWNVPHKIANPAVQEAFANTGVEKQRLIQQIVPYVQTGGLTIKNGVDPTTLGAGLYYINNAVGVPTNQDDGFCHVYGKFGGSGITKIRWYSYSSNEEWMQTFDGSTWSGWVQENASAALWDLGIYIPKDSDLNTYSTPGKYYVASATIGASLANAPTTDPGTLFVFKGNNANIFWQFYIHAPGGKVWSRRIITSTQTYGAWTLRSEVRSTQIARTTTSMGMIGLTFTEASAAVYSVSAPGYICIPYVVDGDWRAKVLNTSLSPVADADITVTIYYSLQTNVNNV